MLSVIDLRHDNVYWHSENQCQIGNGKELREFYLSANFSTVSYETLRLLGSSQQFHIEKAVAVGNIYREILGKLHPKYYVGYDRRSGLYYRMSESINDMQLWPDVVDTTEESLYLYDGQVSVLGHPLDVRRGCLQSSDADIQIRNLIAIGVVASILGDVDVNPSNIGVILNKTCLDFIKIDPECGFSYLFFDPNCQRLIACLKKFPDIDIGLDYYESIIDDFSDNHAAVRALFSPTRIQLERDNVIKQMLSIPCHRLTYIVESTISNTFREQKDLILSQLEKTYDALHQFLFVNRVVLEAKLTLKSLVVSCSNQSSLASSSQSQVSVPGTYSA